MHTLVVTVDAGGNTPPAVAIGRALKQRGGTVTVLGHPGQRTRVEAAGVTFETYATAADNDPAQRRSTVGALRAFVAMSADPRIGDDALVVADRVGADVLLVDCLLNGALQRVAGRGRPVAPLVHCPDQYWSRLPRGPVGALLRLRGLSMSRIQAGVDRRILITRPDLDEPVALPDRTRQVGVVWQGTPQAASRDHPPRVLVSLSTTAFPGQERTFQTVLHALGGLPVDVVATAGPAVATADLDLPANATVHRWLDHGDVLPTTSLVVGHGGWSTTTRALSYGVPVLVIPSHPMLDQPLVGRTLAEHDLGATLPPKSTADRIAETVRRLLQATTVAARTAAIGEDIRRHDGALAAAEALEELTHDATAGG